MKTFNGAHLQMTFNGAPLPQVTSISYSSPEGEQREGVDVVKDLLSGRISFGLPVCSVCRHRVDSLEMRDDVHMRRITLIAKCHGAEEKIRVHYEDLRDAKDILLGEAFATKALPEKR